LSRRHTPPPELRHQPGSQVNSLGAPPLSRRHTPPPELRHQPGSQVNSLGAPPLSRRHTPPPELYTTSQDHRSTVLGHRRLACLANLDQARAARPALGARPADADVGVAHIVECALQPTRQLVVGLRRRRQRRALAHQLPLLLLLLLLMRLRLQQRCRRCGVSRGATGFQVLHDGFGACQQAAADWHLHAAAPCACLRHAAAAAPAPGRDRPPRKPARMLHVRAAVEAKRVRIAAQWVRVRGQVLRRHVCAVRHAPRRDGRRAAAAARRFL